MGVCSRGILVEVRGVEPLSEIPFSQNVYTDSLFTYEPV